LREISLLSKKSTNLKNLFEERKAQSSDHETPEDIFYDPSRLLEICGLKGVLDDEPFKYIRTAGSVWEFYLIGFAKNISRRQYKKLIKHISWQQKPIAGCTRRKVGNPYDKWNDNYPEIENRDIRKATESFANKLVVRECPIRQQGNEDFATKRKNAAQSFFEYLIGGKITKKLFEKLRECEDSQNSLIHLIKNYPQNDLFITSGLMTCLYGGRNTEWVDAKLASAVATAMKRKTPNTIVENVCNILNSKKNNKDFKPPYKNIYDVKGGNRERVNINFRIQTWLKLLGDTLNASK